MTPPNLLFPFAILPGLSLVHPRSGTLLAFASARNTVIPCPNTKHIGKQGNPDTGAWLPSAQSKEAEARYPFWSSSSPQASRPEFLTGNVWLTSKDANHKRVGKRAPLEVWRRLHRHRLAEGSDVHYDHRDTAGDDAPIDKFRRTREAVFPLKLKDPSANCLLLEMGKRTTTDKQTDRPTKLAKKTP